MSSRLLVAAVALALGRHTVATEETEKVCATPGSCFEAEDQESSAMKTSLLQLNSRGLANAEAEESDEPETKSKEGCSDSCPPDQCAGLEMCTGCSWCIPDRSSEAVKDQEAVAAAPKEMCMSFCTIDLCESEPKRCGACDTCAEGLDEQVLKLDD
eukprot:TRINITY_DN471_c0_g1_i1.p1 TRINITY_DN471_c0_g1~~TRINITY_DN471_c0_g1_i1.p1  ORF type:complete len:156 (+),score=44.98 TRINITY_DN471_c0_g1_i1:91-558(+)